MIKSYEHPDKSFFIYENGVDDELFEEIFQMFNHQLKNGNQSVRFAIENIETKKIYAIHQKMYKHFTDYEKAMFHSDYTNSTKYTLLRRDSDITVPYELQCKILAYIDKIISDIYGIDEVECQYSSGIEYGPGYMMAIHSDATPHNPRLCTAVLYCNDMKDGDEGGDVLFYDNHKDENVIYTYRPKRNQVVVFDSHINDFGIPHSVTQIKNWNRYVYRIYYKTPIEKNELI